MFLVGSKGAFRAHQEYVRTKLNYFIYSIKYSIFPQHLEDIFCNVTVPVLKKKLCANHWGSIKSFKKFITLLSLTDAYA